MPEGRAALVEDLLAMSNEQQATAAELGPKARVVDRCDHRLPGPGSGDEQVAMVALMTGEHNMIEQRLLEGAELELYRTEEQDVCRRKLLRAPRELLGLVTDEVGALPVAREDGRHL